MTTSLCKRERVQGGTDHQGSKTHCQGNIQLKTLMIIRISIGKDHHPDICHQGIIHPISRVTTLIRFIPQEIHHLDDHKDTNSVMMITIKQTHTGSILTTNVGDDILNIITYFYLNN